MGFLDKAKDLLSKHDDKVDQALDKAGEHAKGRFAGHEGHIDKAVDMAQQRSGDGDTTAPPPPEQPAEGSVDPAAPERDVPAEPRQAPPPQQ